MKKPKIYLDTSVISHLDQQDVPDKMKETLQFWDGVRERRYIVLLSDVTLEELERCPEEKKFVLYSYLRGVDLQQIEETDESLMLTNRYLDLAVLKSKSRDDCRHIAIATVNDCDFIVSWNFKHLVNVKTIDKVQAVNKLLGYREIKIVPPPMLLEEDES